MLQFAQFVQVQNCFCQFLLYSRAFLWECMILFNETFNWYIDNCMIYSSSCTNSYHHYPILWRNEVYIWIIFHLLLEQELTNKPDFIGQFENRTKFLPLSSLWTNLNTIHIKIQLISTPLSIISTTEKYMSVHHY